MMITLLSIGLWSNKKFMIRLLILNSEICFGFFPVFFSVRTKKMMKFLRALGYDHLLLIKTALSDFVLPLLSSTRTPRHPSRLSVLIASLSICRQLSDHCITQSRCTQNQSQIAVWCQKDNIVIQPRNGRHCCRRWPYWQTNTEGRQSLLEIQSQETRMAEGQRCLHERKSPASDRMMCRVP